MAAKKKAKSGLAVIKRDKWVTAKVKVTKAGKVSQAKKYATTSIAKSLAADWKYMAKKNNRSLTIGPLAHTLVLNQLDLSRL